jgi:hypothetical protein
MSPITRCLILGIMGTLTRKLTALTPPPPLPGGVVCWRDTSRATIFPAVPGRQGRVGDPL